MADCGPSASRMAWLVRDGGSEEQPVPVILEEPLSLIVDGHQMAVLMRLPGLEKELVAGFLVTEGLVHDIRDVWVLRHCGLGLPEPGDSGAPDVGPESRNRVEVRLKPGALHEDARMDVVRLIRAGCGAVDVDRAELPLDPLPTDDLCVPREVLLTLPQTMRDGQTLRQSVGGVHAAALYDASGELVMLCEDVGRHNAVDKAVGHCLLRGIPLHDKLLLCSGRLSYEMVTKAIRARLPVVASVSAPTALAVDIAQRHHLTLIGYLRGGRMTIYSHVERIALD